MNTKDERGLSAAEREALRARVRLLALDCDSTALTTDKRLTPRTADAIRAVEAGGRRVCFSTGRMLGSTARYGAEAGIEGPHVVLNGSLVAAAEGPPLFAAALPREQALRSLSIDADAALFWLTRSEILSADLGNERWRYMITWNNGEAQREVADLAAIEEAVFQLHWVGPEASLRSIAAAFETPELRPTIFPSARGSHCHLEVRRAGVSKASGLTHLQRLMGITAAETLAIGDWLNDAEMLREAGFGIAMANAEPEIKALADHVLPLSNDEEGVADFLERVFLA